MLLKHDAAQLGTDLVVRRVLCAYCSTDHPAVHGTAPTWPGLQLVSEIDNINAINGVLIRKKTS